MWLRFEWQFAQITDEVSRKSTRPCVTVPAMLSNGNLPVYGVAPPTSTAVVAVSAGNREHANVSCTQRVRRNARFEKYAAFMPGCVSRPTVAGALFVQLFGANVASWTLNVGHVPAVAVSTSR